MIRNSLYICVLLGLILGCSGTEESQYTKYAGESAPYVLKDGCSFKIVSKDGTASVSSPRLSGTGAALVSASSSVSLGEYKIVVAECEVVDNPAFLPVYEK